jgi:hypothetical protein
MEKRPHLIPSVIAAAMLFIALGHLPYGYYTLLRFVVCGAATFVAFVGYSGGKIWAAWLFAFVAVLFNPIIKIHFHKDAWQVLDFICACVFLITAFTIKKPTYSGGKKND